MQDRTPQIAEHGPLDSNYTGKHPSEILRYLGRAGAKGAPTSRLMALLGIRESQVADFADSMDRLIDLGLIASKEYDALPENKKALHPGQIWRTK